MADGEPSFWGPVTSTTDWCEKNYVYSLYVAEFYNSLSNIPGIILAFVGLWNALRQGFEKRFSILHMSNLALAIGSIIFHVTLNRVQQQWDETPMVWEMLLYIYILYSPDWHYQSTMPTFLCLYAAVFAVVHSFVHFAVIFKMHYTLLCLLCIPRMYKYYLYTEDKSAKWLARLYIISLLLGGVCCLFDRLFCKWILGWYYFNPQGHALWHIFMGFNSYVANAFLMYCRAHQLGWKPNVAYWLGYFPYVKIQKPKIE